MAKTGQPQANLTLWLPNGPPGLAGRPLAASEEVARACNSAGLGWQTPLTAHVEPKGLFAPLANPETDVLPMVVAARRRGAEARLRIKAGWFYQPTAEDWLELRAWRRWWL